MMNTDLVPRTTLSRICTYRAQALQLFESAYDALRAADAAILAAKQAAAAAAPGVNRFNYHSDSAKKAFLRGLDIPERDVFLATARKLTDTDVWAYLVDLTDLQRLMDKTAKDQLNQQLLTDPPEATKDNIVATLRQFALDADTIFKRGIAECFSNLDRRFRSHDGWKIGSRVILSGAFNEYGSWSYYRNHRDTLRDIERTFFVLDEKTPPPNYGGIVGAVDSSRHGFGAHQSTAESDFFRIRVYQNGNAHVWFKREDLVEKANKLLAEYYGAAIPEEREPEEDTGLFTPKTGVAKNYGFFPTPDAAADAVFDRAPFYRRDGEPPFTLLEPSAGTGCLSARAVKKGAIVDCVEVQPALAEQLRQTQTYRRVIQADFLVLRPDPDHLYDRVVMNPPFDRERDIDHVIHALQFLKPNGHLTAIMSAGTEFRETKKSIAFRALMEKLNASWSDLPAGSFASVGTNVNTIILRVWKDGRRSHW